jgi:hypothetical protein
MYSPLLTFLSSSPSSFSLLSSLFFFSFSLFFETKQNKMKQNEMKRNKMKQNEIKRNKMKQNETK